MMIKTSSLEFIKQISSLSCKEKKYKGTQSLVSSVMSQSPTNSESLSKYLRSKQIQIPVIVDLVKNDYNGIYFPRGDLFVFELLVDRFNEQNKNNFIKNAEMWKLCNQLWDRIIASSDLKLLIKLYKKLKLYQILVNVQPFLKENDELEIEISNFLNRVKRSSLSLDVQQPDLCFKMICGFVEKETFDITLIEKLMLLMDFHSKADQSRFLQYLLYKSPNSLLQFFKVDNHILNSVIYKYVFHPDIIDDKQHIPKLLEKAIKSSDSNDQEPLVKLFEMVVKTKSDFTESVFEQISEITSTIVPKLLSSLSNLTKKNLISEQILNKVLLTTLNSTDIQWKLVQDALKINIELGINNVGLIMSKLEETENNELAAWEQLILCYVNAREFHIFITDVLISYNNDHPTSKLITNSEYHSIISAHISNLSTTQLLMIINKLNDTPSLLLFVIKGLHNPVSLQYIKDSQELKTVLHDLIFLIFDFKTNANKIMNWELTFNVMELYYSCFDIQQDLEDWNDQYELLIKKYNSKKNQQHDQYYYFTLFKLRELIEIPNELISNGVMKWLQSGKLRDEESLYQLLFSRWSSLINAVFSKPQLQYLCNKLINEYPSTLTAILRSDDTSNNDIFEEEEIMYELVSNIFESITKKKEFINTKFVDLIPIQCWNKNTRISLIDTLFENISTLTEYDSISYLLTEYPTFRSQVETDFNKLVSTLKYDEQIFKIVWNNHLTRWRESTDFINSSFQYLISNMDNEANSSASLIIILLSDNLQSDLFGTNMDELLRVFINYCFTTIQVNQWSMQSLYKVLTSKDFSFKQDFIKEKISPLFNSEKENNLTFHFKDCDPENEEKICDTFALFTTTLETQEDILLGLVHYLVLASNGYHPACLSTFVKTKIAADVSVFNFIFKKIASNINSDSDYKLAVLEVYRNLLKNIPSKDETLTVSFTHSIGQIIELGDDEECMDSLLSIVDTVKHLLVTQQWIFSQYSIELLFPMCCKLVSKCQLKNSKFEECVEITTQLLSSVLNFHHFRLTNRYHLVNSAICFYLEVLSHSKEESVEAAQNIARLITNYCEPSKPTGSSDSQLLHSKISMLKKNLRRSISPVLLKYIKLCVGQNNNSLSNALRQELITSIYAIFDILSQDELVTVNASLDYSGKTYFKKVYDEYKVKGKWRED